MAKLSKSQLVEVSNLVDTITEYEADNICVGTVFVENLQGANIGAITYDGDTEVWVWEQSS